MHVDFGIAAAATLVGFVVGLTGMGGGALMTPILVLLFGIDPGAAVSSDLVAAVIMKPVGGGVHATKGTVNYALVGWLALGSVPAALAGSYTILHIGTGPEVEDRIKHILGGVLLLAAAGMVAKSVLTARRRVVGELPAPIVVKPIPTLLIGVMGGFIVGMTSVGSGSLMIVALMLLYPTLAMREMVGTDLVQAIPLVLAAAAGHLIWDQSFSWGLTTSVILGSVPGVFVGAHLSSKAKDSVIRPVLVTVLTLSAAKLLGASNEVLLTLICVAVVAGITTMVVLRSRRAGASADPEPIALT